MFTILSARCRYPFVSRAYELGNKQNNILNNLKSALKIRLVLHRPSRPKLIHPNQVKPDI